MRIMGEGQSVGGEQVRAGGGLPAGLQGMCMQGLSGEGLSGLNG